MYKLIAFCVVSAIIVLLSRKSLLKPHSHGFYRTFAFEAILLLVLYNAEVWFKTPFSPFQILSWFFLTISLIVVGYGFYQLYKHGKPHGSIEATTQLITSGIFAYIRHPLYSSLLWLGVGVFLKRADLVGGSLVLAILAFVVATARIEESENVEHFGAAYEDYRQRTKMFIPFIF